MRKLIITLLLLFTLTACGSLEAPKYKVIFDANDGNFSDGNATLEVIVDEDTVVTLPEEPTKEGYVFLGWYVSLEGDSLFKDEIAINANLTVYAHWVVEEANVYTITLIYNGQVHDTITVTEGVIMTLPELDVEGYTLEGWYTDEDLTERVSGFPTFTEDTTIYAKTEVIQTYIVLMHESLVLDYKIVDYGEEWDISDLEFTFPGFTFEGFYYDYSKTTKVNDVVVGGITNEYLFANFVLGEDVTDITTLAYYDLLSDSNPEVTITTNFGVMTLQLFPSIAPNTVNNFITYIQAGSYSGSTFHRVINEFMIQGGMVEDTGCTINGDFLSNGFYNMLVHSRGVLSMARTSIPNSATSQFFIVHQDSSWLNGEYAAFGGLTHGFNVLDVIAIKPTDDYDKPMMNVVIESITIDLNGYVVDDVVCTE